MFVGASRRSAHNIRVILWRYQPISTPGNFLLLSLRLFILTYWSHCTADCSQEFWSVKSFDISFMKASFLTHRYLPVSFFVNMYQIRKPQNLRNFFLNFKIFTKKLVVTGTRKYFLWRFLFHPLHNRNTDKINCNIESIYNLFLKQKPFKYFFTAVFLAE